MLFKSILLVTTLAVSFSTANDPKTHSKVAQGTVTTTVTTSAVPTDRPDLCSSINDLCRSMTGLPPRLCDSIAGACPSCSDSNGTFWKTIHCIEDTLAPKVNVSAIKADLDTISSPNCTAVKDICYSVPDASFDSPQNFICNRMYTNCIECSSKGSSLNEFGDCFKLPPMLSWEVSSRSAALVSGYLVERDDDPSWYEEQEHAPETPEQKYPPEAPEVVDPDTNSINSFNGLHSSDPESTVNCNLAAYTSDNNPLMDNERCLGMVNECYQCAQLEKNGCDSDPEDDEFRLTRNDDENRVHALNNVMCSVATAQRCYNAAFNFGTLITSNITLGYGCEQAKQTCDQKMHNFHNINGASKSAFDPECQHQYDACLSCRVQEHACRSGPSDGRPDKDNTVVASKSFCSAQAASCFGNAMTSNGTWEHAVNVTNSEAAGHFTDYFTDYLTHYFTEFEDEGESNNFTTVTTAVFTVTRHA